MTFSFHRRCVVEIGGIPIAVRTDDPRLFGLIERRYSGFLSASPPEFEIELQRIEQAITNPDDDVRVKRDGGEWVLQRGDFHARWNPLSRQGTVRQDLNPYALDSVLRILHSLILAERNGFLLHAASAICDGKGYLFSGVSGAGKTTLTRLAPPDVTLLTDEISYVREALDLYSAYGTPFAGELAQPGENCSTPVSALFFLEQGPENRVEELPASEAMHRLMRNILFFADDPQLLENVLNTACDFVSRVPACRLVFYPDARVWDAIRQFEGLPAYV